MVHELISLFLMKFLGLFNISYFLIKGVLSLLHSLCSDQKPIKRWHSYAVEDDTVNNVGVVCRFVIHSGL